MFPYVSSFTTLCSFLCLILSSLSLFTLVFIYIYFIPLSTLLYYPILSLRLIPDCSDHSNPYHTHVCINTLVTSCCSSVMTGASCHGHAKSFLLHSYSSFDLYLIYCSPCRYSRLLWGCVSHLELSQTIPEGMRVVQSKLVKVVVTTSANQPFCLTELTALGSPPSLCNSVPVCASLPQFSPAPQVFP